MIQLTEVTQNKPATPSYFVIGVNLKSVRSDGQTQILAKPILSDENWDQVWEQVGNSQHDVLCVLNELPTELESIYDLETDYTYDYANGVITFTPIDDTQHRINWINRINSIDEPIFRDMLNFMYLSDVQSSQLEILTGAIERAFQACADGTLTQAEVDDVINSRKALKKPNVTEKSLESEALYFRHCLMIAFVRGIGSGKLHDVQWKDAPQHSIYDCAYGAANYVMRMYYDVQSDLKPTEPCPVVTVAFLDPSESMEDTTVLSRHRVTKKAALALMEWASQEDYLQHYTPAPASQDRTLFGHLTEDGKESLRKAIENADKTRESK